MDTGLPIPSKELPKVLVIGINAWREDATSHTLRSIFRCWDSQKLSMIYTRSDMPYCKECSRFFQISENKVLKSIFFPFLKTGQEVYATKENNTVEAAAEHARYAKVRKKHSYWLTLCREAVWWLGYWKKKELRTFVQEVNPDVLFVPIYPTVYMGWIQRYIQRLTGKPMVCYLADDNYSYASCNGLFSIIHRFLLRQQVRYLATHCAEMFVIVGKEKRETDKLFGTDSIILTKGLDFTKIQYQEHQLNQPIRFVYTGNLIIGRDRTLALLADILNEINSDSVKATLEIYSPDVVSQDVMDRLNHGCSHYRGFIARDKVEEVQRAADVVIFAEAIDGKEMNAARLSFSTKITDYLANGKCILAVGKKDIAPMEYFIENDAALVAFDSESLREQIKVILANPAMISEYSQKAFACAQKNHDKVVLDDRLKHTMLRAVHGKVDIHD